MRHYKFLSGLLLMVSTGFFGFGLPVNIQQKVVKEVEKTFSVTDFEMKELRVNDSINSKLPTKITGDNFFIIRQNGSLIGYAFVDQAQSKTAQFDYLVLFDRDLTVIHSKVLIYREEYGGEIGSKRWLRQFEGMSGKDRVSLSSNIDAISGATISVRSMTRAMDNLLQTVGKLQEKHLL